MANSVKLMIYMLKRSVRAVLPLYSVLLVAEAVFFIGARIAGEAGTVMIGLETYRLLPAAFYLAAFAVPFVLFLRGAVGCEACFMRGLPVYPDTLVSAMMINSLVCAVIAELLRTGVCAFGLFSTSSLLKLEDGESFMLLFSVYGMSGYALCVTRNILAVMFFQLFAAMVTLLADLSATRKRLLAFVYGTVGGALMYFAFMLLSYSSAMDSESSGAAFILYVPQIICMLCFITVFGVVSAAILKRRREIG